MRKMWIDNDAFPLKQRAILGKVIERHQIEAYFVANRQMPKLSSELCIRIIVSEEIDSADKYIIEHADSGDIALTRDLELAYTLLDKGLTVLNDYGTIFTYQIISESLARKSIISLAHYNDKNVYKLYKRKSQSRERKSHNFASTLDRILNSEM